MHYAVEADIAAIVDAHKAGYYASENWRVLYARLCHERHWDATTAKQVWDTVQWAIAQTPPIDDDIPF